MKVTLSGSFTVKKAGRSGVHRVEKRFLVCYRLEHILVLTGRIPGEAGERSWGRWTL